MKSVYPSISDPFTQQMSIKVTKADVLRELKIQALLFDVISPSISHLLTSRRTYEALQEQPELLTEGIIQPMIPKSLENIEDYIQWIKIEEENLWLKKLGINLTMDSQLLLYLNRDSFQPFEVTSGITNAQRALKERVCFLNSYVKKFVHYDQVATIDMVRKSITRDLDPELSPFAGEFKNKEEIKRIKSLTLEILDHRGRFDRDILFTCINNWKLKDGFLLKQIINRIYFICGAAVTDQMLGLDLSYVPLISKASQDLTTLESKYLIARRAFDQLLGHLQVDPLLIEALDIDSLKEIRKWSKANFQKTFWSFVGKWEKGMITVQDVKENVRPEIRNLNKELDEALKSEIDKQKKNYREIKARVSRFKRTMEVLAFFGTFLTSLGIANWSIITTLSTASRLTADPLSRFLENRRCNFITFVSKIKEASGV